MKNAPAVMLAVLLIVASVSASGGQDSPLRLAVRVFRIPAEQSFEVERPDWRGGTCTLRVSGDIAARFPQGTVFVPTELAANASESAIGGAIGRSVAFGCAGLPAERIEARELKSFDISLNAAHPSEEARFEEKRGEGQSDDYELRVERLPSGPGKPFVRFTFFAGSSWRAGSLAGGLTRDVIATVAEVPESKLLLIGAPGEKAVYFLAVCAGPR
jgi:hypothetical protein